MAGNKSAGVLMDISMHQSKTKKAIRMDGLRRWGG